jgi:apolipoprotein N-acyltransferase
MASTGSSTVTSQAMARRLVGAVVAGALGVVALSSRGLGALAWVALVPLFLALDTAGPGPTLAVVIVYALVLGVGSLGPWLSHAAAPYFGIGRPAALGYAGGFLVAIFALHGAVLGLLLLPRPRRVGPWQVVWCAAAWACWDAGRTALWPRFPGGVLALSQHDAVPILQAASVAGIGGITFLVVAVNVALAALLAPSAASVQRRALTAAVGIGVAAIAVVWGVTRVQSEAVDSSSGPRVVMVDVDATERAASTIERYLVASESALAAHPALLVWPESALPTDVEHDRAAFATLTAFVAEHATPLLAGGPGAAPGDGRVVLHFNSAHLFRPGQGLRSYHKRGLVPFAERWPAILGAPPPDLASLDPGRDATVFPLDGGGFGVLICFEITDAGAARALVRAGARFIVNLSNDAWFVDPPHLPWAALRAVETGVPVLRAANAGTSALFDRFGRPVAMSRPRGVTATLTVTVPPAAPSPYVRHGDVFLGACGAVLLAGFLRALLARRDAATGGGTPRQRRPGQSS